MRDRVFHAADPAASPGRWTLLVTFTPGVRVSLICSDPGERRRLEPLIELVRTVIDSALARGLAGAA